MRRSYSLAALLASLHLRWRVRVERLTCSRWGDHERWCSLWIKSCWTEKTDVNRSTANRLAWTDSLKGTWSASILWARGVWPRSPWKPWGTLPVTASSCPPARNSPVSPAPGCTAGSWKTKPSRILVARHSYCTHLLSINSTKPTWACRPRWTSSEDLRLSCLVFPRRRPLSRFYLLPPTAACKWGGEKVPGKWCFCNTTESSQKVLRGKLLTLLCHFSNAVHVETRNLLGHHAAHGQLQLQQRRSKPVVLVRGGRVKSMSSVMTYFEGQLLHISRHTGNCSTGAC